MAKVIIGCRLPNGISLTHPNPDIKVKVTLNGVHASKIIGATHATTEVDADFWESWKTAYSTYTPLVSGAIFEARNETEATVKARDLRKEKTGFEPLNPESHGVKKAVA